MLTYKQITHRRAYNVDNCCLQDRDTPLLIASRKGMGFAIKQRVKHKADMGTVAKLCVKHKADVNAQNKVMENRVYLGGV